MRRNIALFFIVMVSSFFAVQPAFAQEHNFQDISQKIEKLSEGLISRIGVAAQEIGSGDCCYRCVATAVHSLTGSVPKR